MEHAVRVGLAGALLCLSAIGRANAADEPVFRCPPITQEVAIDGELEAAEWDRSSAIEITPEKLVRRDPEYGGPADLSGRIYVARSATTLYVAGEVHDDTLFWNNKVTFLGDGVEVFLDFHPDPKTRTEPGYDAYTHQLLLHPLSSEVRWRFAKFRGRDGKLDDEVDGIRLAGLPLREKGATVGYTFEAAIPLSNFPAAPSLEGESFGFDVALSDSDGLPQQENYGTWSGRGQLSESPQHFGRLELGKAPPAPEETERPVLSPIVPLALLVSLLGALLFLWLARMLPARHRGLARALDRLRAVRPRAKLGTAALLAALIALAGFAGDWVADVLTERDVEQKRELSARLRTLAEQAERYDLLDPQPPVHPSPLVSLLGGKPVRPPAQYEYTVIAPALEVPNQTLDGVPYLRRDIPAHSAWSGTFVVQPPVVATGATMVYAWTPDAGKPRPAASEVLARVRLVRRDGTVEDVEVKGDAEQHDFKLGASESPVLRVDVEQIAQGGTFHVRGVTLRGPGGEPVPQPLGRATSSGVPTCASPFPAQNAGLLLDRANPTATVDCDAPADRLWIVASLRFGYVDHRYRAPVLHVEADFDDGSTDGPFRLENGVSVDAETAPAHQHGEGYTSSVAFEWGLLGQPRRHFDLVPLELERPGRRLTRVRFEFLGEEEVVRVSSITAGAAADEKPPPQDGSFQSGPDGYRLAAQDLAAWGGLVFTMFRDGAAVATTASGDLRPRLLARSMPAQQTALAARQQGGVHEVRVVEGRRLHTLAIPLVGARTLEVAWTSNVEPVVTSKVWAIRAALAALLAPVLVLVVADLVLRVRSLHARLVGAFAAAAAVPVLLGWFVVPLLLGSKIESAERETVIAKAVAVKSRLAALRSLARQRADTALVDEALQEALKRRGSPEFRGAVAAALRDLQRNIATATRSDARIALEVTELSSEGESIVFPEQVQWTVFADPTPSRTDELAYRMSRLIASGVATKFDTTGNWRVTLVVELPLEREALTDATDSAGGGVQALLYTPRGYPLASTLETRGEDTDGEMAHKQRLIRRVLAEQQPAVEARVLGGSLHTVAYDVLRGQSDVVSLVATALPRSGTEALLNRVSVVSLLVFGAGVGMQFLLAGLVVGSTSRPFSRILEQARLAASDTPPHHLAPRDELATLESSLGAVHADREVYRSELARLHDTVAELASAADPDVVVERALRIVRTAAAPWGALLIATDSEGRPEALGGFRGGEAVPRSAVGIPAGHPVEAAVEGRSEVHLPALDGVPELIGRNEGDLLSGASRLEAYPLGGEAGPRGALVLLHGQVGSEPAARRGVVHAEFLATLARQVGLALHSARLVRLAVHDAETGTYVPSFFDQRLKEEVDRAVTGRNPIALLLVRAEALPSEAASARRAVQQLAEIVRHCAPARAFVGRPADGTLAVAVPESDRRGAEALALELHRGVAQRELGELRVRIGLAACPEDAGSFEFLHAEARRSLEQAREPRSSEGAPRAPDPRERLVADARRFGVVFESGKGVQILQTVERIAASDITILIEGETGTGKEVVADLIHRTSARRDRPMVKVNCAALPDALLESELFGYERGAFTGADRSKPGRFELANGGTIFLDEIGEMPLATQVKLLRVLEDRAVEHLGGTKPTPIDVRVIAATNRDLRAAMAQGRFREDLYYRLNAVTVAVPPLRARKEDIPSLAENFVRAAAEAHGRRPPTIAPDAMDLLFHHDWPGNVRELRNVMEQAVVLSGNEVLRGPDLGPVIANSASARARVREANAPTRPAYETAAPRPAAQGGTMSDRQRRLLAVLSEREWITNGEYCDIVGISTRTGLRDLQELLERGVIRMEGKRRGARYRLR